MWVGAHESGTFFSPTSTALAKNVSTLAVVPLDQMLGEQGYLESLRKRGYEILAPG